MDVAGDTLRQGNLLVFLITSLEGFARPLSARLFLCRVPQTLDCDLAVSTFPFPFHAGEPLLCIALIPPSLAMSAPPSEFTNLPGTVLRPLGLLPSTLLFLFPTDAVLLCRSSGDEIA